MKFYHTCSDTVGAPDETTYIFGPNCWKVYLSLLRKGVPVELVPSPVLDTVTTLAGRRAGDDAGARVTLPAIELDDGRLLCDSFRIAEWLEAEFPQAPSVFAAGPSTAAAVPAALAAGRAYARLIDLGADSSAEWTAWYELAFPYMQARVPAGAARDYFTSDVRHGPGGFARLSKPSVERLAELRSRARANAQPFALALRERPGEFLQGPEPGFVDFVVFGRYAMLRNANPELAKEVWEDVDPAIGVWVGKILDYFGRDQLKKHLRPMV
ncbi:hypothetical protein HK405_002098 [Cladochytrium tenue]|nr:hypothetical protein HK405_002098 [Cladochytrium tenue]